MKLVWILALCVAGSTVWQVTEASRSYEQIMDLQNRILQSTVALRNCEFETRERDGTVYMYSKFDAVNAEKAQEVCRAFGGYLVEIDDEEESNFVSRVIKVEPGKIINYLIAGTDAAEQGTWVSGRTGKPLGFLNWRSGEPANHSGEDVLTLTTLTGRNPMQMDDHFDVAHLFICELPPTQTC